MDTPVPGRGRSDERPDGHPSDGHAIVVLGGHPPDRRVLEVLSPAHAVICADSGLDHAVHLGLEPTIVIGDMDSVDPRRLATARAAGCAIVEHSPHKDFTDTELALCHAVETGHRHITVVWGGGDRIDHVLGVFAALAHPKLASLEGLCAWLAADRIDVLHPGRSIVVEHEFDTTLSLLAIGGIDSVVTTRGLKWELAESRLSCDSARGLSNVVVSTPCAVHSTSGVTAVVAPGLLSHARPRTNAGRR